LKFTGEKFLIYGIKVAIFRASHHWPNPPQHRVEGKAQQGLSFHGR
jgi:hypothetical protein